MASLTPLVGVDDQDTGIDFDWAMAGKIDSDEAVQSAVSPGGRVVILVVAVGIIIGLIAILQARRLTRPTELPPERADFISIGDMSVEIPHFKGLTRSAERPFLVHIGMGCNNNAFG